MPENKIPFARKVKVEIATNQYSPSEKKFILSGFVRNGGSFSIGKNPTLTLQTELAPVAKLLFSALKEVYSLSPEIVYEKIKRFKQGLVYTIRVVDSRLYDVMEDLEIFKDDGLERIPPQEGLKQKNFKFLLIGCFLANGSVNNPSAKKTSYYAEMAFSDKKDSLVINKKLDSFKEERTMSFKYILRREKHVLYLKKSDQISVFLTFLGATEAMFEFENIRILKDDINTNNRLAICDSANYVKTLAASKKDIDDINLVLKYKNIEFFDDKTRAVINARLTLTDANYRELAEEVTQKGIQITKSGVVHILRGIREKADELRKRENTQDNA